MIQSFARKFMCTKRSDEKGATLVEMLGVIALLGAMSVGMYSLLNSGVGQLKLKRSKDQLTTVVENIRKTYGNDIDYAGISVAYLNSENAFLKDMVIASDDTQVRLSTGGKIDTITATSNAFRLYLKTANYRECVELMASVELFGKGHKGPYFLMKGDHSSSRDNCWDWNGSTACDSTVSYPACYHFDCLDMKQASEICDDETQLQYFFY